MLYVKPVEPDALAAILPVPGVTQLLDAVGVAVNVMVVF